jgi:hypothetical protein
MRKVFRKNEKGAQEKSSKRIKSEKDAYRSNTVSVSAFFVGRTAREISSNCTNKFVIATKFDEISTPALSCGAFFARSRYNFFTGNIFLRKHL